VGESDLGILRNRNSALHRQNQPVVLPHPQFIDDDRQLLLLLLRKLWLTSMANAARKIELSKN
jgi:hypothetical protein